jgi:hypothetical protein
VPFEQIALDESGADFDTWLDLAGAKAAVTLSVEAEGAEPMGFRWRRNSTTLLSLNPR